MNLRDALTTESLTRSAKSENCPCDAARVSADQIARNVFAQAEQSGAPFENQTSDQWKRKWLASHEFILMDVFASQVAVPLTPLNRNKVLQYMAASADSTLP